MMKKIIIKIMTRESHCTPGEPKHFPLAIFLFLSLKALLHVYLYEKRYFLVIFGNLRLKKIQALFTL